METQCSKYPQFSFLRNTYIHPSLERTDSKYVQMELCQRNSWGLWECSQTSYCATWMHQPTLCKGIHRSKVYPFHLLKCIHLKIHITIWYVLCKCLPNKSRDPSYLNVTPMPLMTPVNRSRMKLKPYTSWYIHNMGFWEISPLSSSSESVRLYSVALSSLSATLPSPWKQNNPLVIYET